MRVVVIAVDVAAVFDFAFQSVDGKVQAAEASGFVGFLDAVDGEFRRRVLFMFRHEPRGLDKHAPRTTCRIENASVIRLDNFGEKADDAARRVEFAAALAFAHGKLAEEILVNAAKGVVVQRGGNLGDLLEQFLQEGAGKKVVSLGQDPGELRIVLLDVAHRLIDLRPDVFRFRQGKQKVKAGIWHQIKNALGMVGTRIIHPAAAT